MYLNPFKYLNIRYYFKFLILSSILYSSIYFIQYNEIPILSTYICMSIHAYFWGIVRVILPTYFSKKKSISKKIINEPLKYTYYIKPEI